jgi:GH15 family glucan-1,4-alpha-glucosidase
LLNVGSNEFQNAILKYADALASETKLGLLPAFWPPIFDTDEHWNLLKNNCKYEFRNYPYEFHNGGSWPMVNGFFGIALVAKGENSKATTVLEKINEANAKMDFSFYENFNTQTTETNGVSLCAWSAAATVLVHQSLYHNFKILI